MSLQEQERLRKIRWAIWLTSIILFVISLACPTYCTNGSCDGLGGGLWDLMFGWLGTFFGGSVYLAWLGNPFFFIAIFSNKNSPGLSLVMSIFALIAGLSFLRGGEVLLNEAGHTAYITDYQIGYWLWLTSFLLMVIAAILSTRSTEDHIEHHIDS